MILDFLNKLCCPIDKKDLKLKTFLKNEKGEILEGLLTCPECNRYYPIIYGIPIMTPDDYREKRLEDPVLNKWGLKSSAHDFTIPALGEKSSSIPKGRSEERHSSNDYN